jgi:tRNA (cytidine32/uridine32-2'-O)-methyltransferase
MAVQILTYELRLAALEAPEVQPEPDSPPATAEDLEFFYEHLEQVLHASGFLDPDNPRLLMRRLRRLYVKAEPDKNEINILRGILTALSPVKPDGSGE